MTFGERLIQVRKKKNLSQSEVAKKIKINGDDLGREVSLDYLVGNTDIEQDQASLSRIQEVTQFNDEEKNHIFVTLDAMIRDFKNNHAYAH